MAPVKKECHSRFNLKGKLGRIQFFSVDTNNRWPVQGWYSGDEGRHELDKDFVAEECSREFTLDQETRCPLQGWCKASQTCKTLDIVPGPKPFVPSKWPQGW